MLIIPDTIAVIDTHTSLGLHSNKHPYIAYKVQMSRQEGSTDTANNINISVRLCWSALPVL